MGSVLAAFVRRHRDEIVGRWARTVSDRLGLASESRPQLINDLPPFLDELAGCLDLPNERWRRSDNAESHGQQRMTLGVDIGALAEEFAMVAETIFEVAAERGLTISERETSTLMRLIGRGTAASVRAYARLRDRQLAEEASRHFSFIAHELRTPLYAARLAAQLLASGRGSAAEHLARLERAHVQLAGLVDNALVDARLQGEPILRLEAVTARELLNEAAENARLIAERRAIDLTVQGDDVEVEVDRKVIVSALTNLVVNAVKFSRERTQVAVRARARDGRVLFEVSDGCGGLTEEIVPRLFQPFVQAGTDRSGFGLGLMIVKQAVEAHKGVVRVINDPGRGCCFVVEIDRLPPAA